MTVSSVSGFDMIMALMIGPQTAGAAGPCSILRGLSFAGAFAAGSMLALASPASAQDRVIDCDKALSQNDLTACAWQAADKADADMAIALAKAKANAEAMDKEFSGVEPNPTDAVAALELSQSGWLQYREGRCIIKGFAERGGSMEPMVVGWCREKLTRARIVELNTLGEE